MTLTTEQREFAERVIRETEHLCNAKVLFGRVDCLQAADGSLLLTDLELISPRLFLNHSSAAQQRLADWIIGQVGVAKTPSPAEPALLEQTA